MLNAPKALGFRRFNFAAVLCSFAFLAGCTSAERGQSNDSNSNSRNNQQVSEKKGEKVSAGKNPTVVIETSMGNIEVELNQEKAPISTENFLKYADSGHYNGTIFHRVIRSFMIQGGGMTESMEQKPTQAPIKNEATNGLKNDRGTIAMARTGIVDSATSQFFINVVDNGMLNNTGTSAQTYGYAVFGKVTSGMDVVDKIKEVPTTSKGFHNDVPSTPIVIKSVKRK